MFGSLVGALKGLQGEGGAGQGLLKGLGDFSEGFAQGGDSEDPWQQAIGGITSGIQSGMAAREKEKGMPPRPQDNSDVPLAGPMGGPPPGVGEAGIPGQAPMGMPPPPDQIGMEPLRFKDQYANRPLMF